MQGVDKKRRDLHRLSIAFLLSCVAIAWSAAAEPPPPVESYGRLPDLEDVSISPDGSQLAFVGAREEDRMISVVSVGAKAMTLVLPVGKAKLRSLSWADNSHLLIVSSTTSVPPFGLTGPTQEFYQGFVYDLNSRRLTQLQAKDVQSLNVVLGVPFVRTVDGRAKVFFITETFQDHQGVASLFAYDPVDGRTRLVDDGRAGLRAYMLNAKGEEVAQNLWVNGRWRVRLKIDGAWRDLAAVDMPDGPPFMAGLGPAGKAILFAGEIAGKGGWHALSLETGQWNAVNYAADNMLADPQSGLGLGLVQETDHYIFRFFEPAMQARWDAILKAFPGEQVDFVSTSNDRMKVVIKVFGQTNGAAYMLVDMATGQAQLIGDLYKDVPPETVANTRSVAYTAGDGLHIPAYLTLPKGRPAKNLPLVVLAHGGPAARDELEFDWMAQALASRGYAVLQPQFRGSAGLSGDLFRAGFGQWGRKMQTDLSDGVRFLAAQGVIDPKRVCIAGASYGGYAALAGVTLDPGVYRCAVSVSGPSDLGRLVEWKAERNGDARQQTLRYFDRYMKAEAERDPTYSQISPIKAAGKITTPVLIIHGRDDTVVPFEQSKRMVDAMKAAGKAVTFLPLPGEDHWLSRSDTRKQMLTAMVGFIETNNPPDPTAPVSAANP